jgi:hypothetical protein
MKYCDFVTEDLTKLPNDKLIRADVEWSYTYSDLINDTYLDIKKYLNNLNPL